jgi:ABC-type spermidine/putrescine transport system permease subunit II
VSKTFGDPLAFTMSFDDVVITSFGSGSGSSTLPISTIILLVTMALIYLADRLAREN